MLDRKKKALLHLAQRRSDAHVREVEPMRLPQTIAAFHSLVGAAATLTSIGSSRPGDGTGLLRT